MSRNTTRSETHETAVEALMSPEPVTLSPEDSVQDALARFERYSFRHLPVEQANKLVGIVSDRDLAFAHALPRGRRGPGHAQRQPRRVEEIMTRAVRTVAPDTPARTALELLLQHRIGALPVVVEEGRLVGIVTATDFLRLCEREQGWARGHSPAEFTVGQRMSHPVLSAKPEEDLLDAAERLLDSHVRHLPVMEDGVLVGMLSDRDLRRGLARLARADRGGEARGEPEVPRLRVADAMSHQCLSLAKDASLRAAAHTLIECRIGALPVIERRDGEERLIGILSQTDLLRHFHDWNAA